MTDHAFCIHSHFYQSPRGDPFADDELGPEPGAEPYRNFIERVTAECYAPNAEIGNFDLLSFTFGATLLRWLERNAPATLERIQASERAHEQKYGVSNAVAQPVHHSILPLNPTRDKQLQVRWGVMAYEHRFGRAPEGMWLPELAVDLDTLQVLHATGIKYTVLSQGQVDGADAGSGPYWVRLPGGGQLAVFVRDDQHSNEVAFAVNTLGGAGRWARYSLAPLRRTYPGRLFLMALDGEVFGYHHPGEEHFLHWLLTYEAGALGFEVTTLGRELRDHPPVKEISVRENTAWNCPHHLARWLTGCECTPGDSRWKGALRRAFDKLAGQLDEIYANRVQALGADPWRLREDYFRVRLGQLTPAELLQAAGLGHLDAAASASVLDLLVAQFCRQRMYVSTSFFHGELNRAEPRYAIANALRAALLTQRAVETDFVSAFRRDLAHVQAGDAGPSAAHILDEIQAAAQAQGLL